MNDFADFDGLTAEQMELLERIAAGELSPTDVALDAHVKASSAFARALGEWRHAITMFAETSSAYRAALAEPERAEDRELARRALLARVQRTTVESRDVKREPRSRRLVVAAAVLAAAGVLAAVAWWRFGDGSTVPRREVLGGEIELLAPSAAIAAGSELRWAGPVLADGHAYRVEAAAPAEGAAPSWQSGLLREQHCRLDDPRLFEIAGSELVLRVVEVDEFRRVQRRSAWLKVPVRR
ncbi:MAG: hypothetical protein AB7I19_13685 [Planctomycetota bacterium]